VSNKTRGWQVRYGNHPHPLFSDHVNVADGTEKAFKKAIHELIQRMNTYPSPTPLKNKPQMNKKAKLPDGIHGPFWIPRKNRINEECRYSVDFPIFGLGKAKVKHIYIGTTTTYTEQRRRAKLKVAIEVRNKAKEAYHTLANNNKLELAMLLEKMI
jgi:hypothetical protein